MFSRPPPASRADAASSRARCRPRTPPRWPRATGAPWTRWSDKAARPLLLPIRELAALDGDALAHLWRQATAGHRGVLVIEMAAAFDAPAPLYAADVVTRILDIASLGGLVHASLDRGAEWARVEARDVARPDFRIYSGHERALDMVAYGSDYLLATAGCAPEAFAARDRAWRQGAPVGFELNDALQALATLLYRAPIDGARHGALQWLQARGAGRATPRPRPASSCAPRATWRSTARSTPGSNPCSPRPTPPTWRPAPQRPPPLDRDETACPNRCPIHA